LYRDPDTKLLDEKRSDYEPHVFQGNRWVTAAKALRKGTTEPQYAVLTAIGSYHVIERASLFFPEALDAAHGAGNIVQPKPNISQPVAEFLEGLGAGPLELFSHIVATLNAPSYRAENSEALTLDWPRIPLPSDAEMLKASANLGETLSQLLDPETSASGVSTGRLRPGLRTLGLPTKRGAKNLEVSDLALTAGWGSTQGAGSGNRIVMPGRGLMTRRDYTGDELKALEAEASALGLSLDEVLGLIGTKTLDVNLNTDVWWTNVPAAVWDYTLGGYQVIKKWLSYREQSVLGRALKPEEAAYVSEMVRRIAAILLMGPALDANYAAAKANAVEWKDGKPA
jgi:hypothetical protein